MHLRPSASRILICRRHRWRSGRHCRQHERARPLTHAQLAAQLTEIARLAGDEIMKVYAGDFTATRKADQSPVTLADVTAEAVIVAALRRLTPDIPVVAEEEAHARGLPEQAP